MRDNPNHNAPMMGGMWGVKMTSFPQIRNLMSRAMENMLSDGIVRSPRSSGGWDQVALRRYIHVSFHQEGRGHWTVI